MPRPNGGREGDYCTNASVRWRCGADLTCDLGICKSATALTRPSVVDAGAVQPDGADEN
jgi:hypothetical protein